MKLDKFSARNLEDLYRSQLQEIMDEWADHTEDTECGGYITNFDENWNVTGTQKNIWAQARQTYMFSAMYSYIDKNEKWLKLAKTGRDFLVSHAYAGEGRWYYELDRTGKKVLEGTTSIFTDLFVLSALSQYAFASNDKSDLDLIEKTFLSAEKNVLDPYFKDIKPHKWKEGILRHSVYMISVNAAGIAGNVLGRDKVLPFIKTCIDKILNFFNCNTSGFLLESIKEDGTIWDTDEGRLVNPGHIFEGMWFCIDEARVDNRENEILDQVLKIIDITYKAATDKINGGIIHRFDCFGRSDNRLLASTDQPNADDKVDWVHCESLYALALVAVLTKDQQRFKSFLELHDFCQKYFRPANGGDWYPLLSADGKVLKKHKGAKHRVAFHVPRALMKLTLLFREYADQLAAATNNTDIGK